MLYELNELNKILFLIFVFIQESHETIPRFITAHIG